MKYLIFFFFGLNLMCLACNREKNRPELSFYYWKTIFKLSHGERRFIDDNHIKSLFIRYFDVDFIQSEKGPCPISPIKFEQNPGDLKIIPVVFIKNKVMLQKDLEMDELATKILLFIDQVNRSNHLSCNEIQIDCDWTLKSKDNFMNFIRVFKKKSNKRLSVTIRLHQVKYFTQTMIPDADYGVLMYYNMGAISADSLNSIYNRDIALKYIPSLKNYPLKLDVALPVFSQGVHLEQGKVVNLVSKVSLNSFVGDTNYVQLSKKQIHVKNSNIKFGYYFKQNDEIKIESISFDMLKEMAEDLADKLSERPKQIIFFDLDSIQLNNYKNENQNFSEITNCF
jgi:hypothetical protein